MKKRKPHYEPLTAPGLDALRAALTVAPDSEAPVTSVIGRLIATIDARGLAEPGVALSTEQLSAMSAAAFIHTSQVAAANGESVALPQFALYFTEGEKNAVCFAFDAETTAKLKQLCEGVAGDTFHDTIEPPSPRPSVPTTPTLATDP